MKYEIEQFVCQCCSRPFVFSIFNFKCRPNITANRVHSKPSYLRPKKEEKKRPNRLCLFGPSTCMGSSAIYFRYSWEERGHISTSHFQRSRSWRSSSLSSVLLPRAHQSGSNPFSLLWFLTTSVLLFFDFSLWF
jgi:hypothetical protein